MSHPRILLCPGQGAQTVGMGRAWYERSPEARAVFDEADALLGDRLGGKLSELCFAGPAERLNQTDVSQPAIYVTAVASCRGLCAAWGVSPDELAPAALAGLSLGEYTALHLAGAFSFRDGLELVALRGRAMQEAAVVQPSGMLALIGADEGQATAICDEARGSDVLVPANFNAPGQIVLSGHKSAIERAVQAASAKGLRSAVLPVAGAFHSPLMAPAADRLAAALEKTPIAPLRSPVVSNVTARPHDKGDAASIRRLLVEQLTSPVRWAESCGYLVQEVAAGSAVEFHELAPGSTLAGLMRRIDRATKVTTHDEPAHD